MAGRDNPKVLTRSGIYGILEGARGLSPTFESVGMERVRRGPIYAGNYDGADPDERLDAALSDAEDGDRVILEPDRYTADRTIRNSLLIQGYPDGFDDGEPDIVANYTINGRTKLLNIQSDKSSTFTINGVVCSISFSDMAASASVDVAADEFRYIGNHGANVVFQSGTSRGIVDGCAVTDVQDNGSNTVGDIS
jgi:hypothetical protein